MYKRLLCAWAAFVVFTTVGLAACSLSKSPTEQASFDSQVACQRLSIQPLQTAPRAYSVIATASHRDIAGFEYEFGDGKPPQSQRRQPGVAATHMYARPGSYTVTATVWFKQGNKLTPSALPPCRRVVNVK